MRSLSQTRRIGTSAHFTSHADQDKLLPYLAEMTQSQIDRGLIKYGARLRFRRSGTADVQSRSSQRRRGRSQLPRPGQKSPKVAPYVIAVELQAQVVRSAGGRSSSSPFWPTRNSGFIASLRIREAYQNGCSECSRALGRLTRSLGCPGCPSASSGWRRARVRA